MLLIQRLGIALLASAAALLAVSLLMGSLFALAGLKDPSTFFPTHSLARAGFLGALLYGACPAALGGVLYTILSSRHRLGWGSVAVLGALCGSLVAALDTAVLPFGIPAGVFAATVAHGLLRNRLSPHNSSKPTPARGEA